MSYSSPEFAVDREPLVATGVVRTHAGRTRPVLDGLDLTAAPGTRVGLIGENGSGKSTLLRVLAGVDRPDSGQVRRPPDVVYLPQEPEIAPDGTVGDLLDRALRPLHDAVAELERLAGRIADEPDRYDRVLSWAVQHDAWDADRRADVTAAALGVSDLERERPVGTLSGGQRTRLALAAALVRRPSCLLLDEPTNHLDDGALDLLESTLVALPGVVVAASHDRTFLDRVCTELVDLDAGALGTDGRGGRRFTGRLTEYLEHRTAARRRWEERFAAEQDEIDRLREKARTGTEAIAHDRGPRDNDKFIHAFKGANVERTRARRVRDAERRLERAQRDAIRKPPAPLRFSGRLGGAGTGGLAVSIRGLEVHGRVRVDVLDLATDQRLLVTGPNGSGKSTLLAVLAGLLLPDRGDVRVRARRVGLLAQDPELGPADRTAVRTYADAVGIERAERVPLRTLGLLPPAEHATAVRELSLGQRRRLALAIAVADTPDLLLLDEPTNHISLTLAGELEDALGTAPGAVVVASHDRRLRARWDGPVRALPG
ncbi:MAG: ATP-binding cassette domain-containing protein [Actinomycetota bacterium]|nr:ATP-binding cassette domain-containing protein [Actinomycetota bacterium]